MGHETWENMLGRLVELRDRQFRSDPDRFEARVDCMESILQAMLEKLRDAGEFRGVVPR